MPTLPGPAKLEALLRLMLIIVAALLLMTTDASARTWRQYGQHEAAKVGWTGWEWTALDHIVTPESGWNPCARFPSTLECDYSGSNSCGIPQANPCPYAWRGRLGTTAVEQVRWLLNYVRSRYGSPSRAYAFRQAHGWY